MNRIIKLLKEKNNFLERFYLLNEIELINFNQRKFENLALFYQTREDLLKVIQELDLKIDSASTNQLQEDMDPVLFNTKVTHLLARKSSWVNQILDQDLQILSAIENEKSAIIEELGGVQKTRRALKGYRPLVSAR